jgi:hypothetical protein
MLVNKECDQLLLRVAGVILPWFTLVVLVRIQIMSDNLAEAANLAYPVSAGDLNVNSWSS